MTGDRFDDELAKLGLAAADAAASTDPEALALAREEEEVSASGAEPPDAADELRHDRLNHEREKLRLYVAEVNLELDRKRSDIERAKAEVEGLKQDISARKTYSNQIFNLICIWLLGIFLIVFMSAFWGHLSDAVIMALIGGTTVNVLGLFLVVANYLFPKNGNGHQSKPNGGEP